MAIISAPVGRPTNRDIVGATNASAASDSVASCEASGRTPVIRPGGRLAMTATSRMGFQRPQLRTGGHALLADSLLDHEWVSPTALVVNVLLGPFVGSQLIHRRELALTNGQPRSCAIPPVARQGPLLRTSTPPGGFCCLEP